MERSAIREALFKQMHRQRFIFRHCFATLAMTA